MQIDPSTLDGPSAYRLMIACLVPRPIAWVSTLSDDGVPNLAPFSYFGGVSSSPPIVMVSVGRRRGGARKDTAVNLIARGEAVLHIPDATRAEAMVASSAEVPPEVDEFELTGLAREPGVKVAPWRIAGAPIALEAVLERHLEVGRGPSDVFLLEVVRFHLDDAILVDGLPDPARLRAVGRLGGSSYCLADRPFEIHRPGAAPRPTPSR
jgi:flavin reductase (DIM6/NTAB) family NADH-FMN oxidoreductase RutF